MSIAPTTDIVLDVARAADPQRAKAATQTLLNYAGAAPGADFSAYLQTNANKASGAATSSLTGPGPTVSIGSQRSVVQKQTADANDAYQAAGGLLLQKTFENMMPAATSTTFGAGAAGSMWKSMLAQQMAQSIASSVFSLPRHHASPTNSHSSANASLISTKPTDKI